MCSGCERCGGHVVFSHPVGCSLPWSLRDEINRSCGKVEDVEATLAAVENVLLERLGRDGVRDLWVRDYHRREAERKQRERAPMPLFSTVLKADAAVVPCRGTAAPGTFVSFNGVPIT